MIDFKSLVDKAILAREHSYSPYSGFKVGAALLCFDGTTYTGTNVENASFGETICAERVAFLKAVADGKNSFRAIAIVGGRDEIVNFIYPCGSCRQVMREFCSDDFNVILFNGTVTDIHTLGELFPFSFDRNDIK